MMKTVFWKSLMISIAVYYTLWPITSVPANPVGTCIRNCAQCKKMFGHYFKGQLCADMCVKGKGKEIPDCQNSNTIKDYLNKI